MSETETPLVTKAEETRQHILEAALVVFRRCGLEKATMREIAREAGMALGAAYYHFDSKDSLVMAFYGKAQEEMQPLVLRALTSSRDLGKRLEACIGVKLRYFERDRALLRALTGHIDPADPLSPFSRETAAIRENDIRLIRTALQGARQRIHPDLAEQLPTLVWLYQMGLFLYWICDPSPRQQRTNVLLKKTMGVIVTLIQISGLPVLKPVRKMVRELLEAASFDSPQEASGMPDHRSA